MVVVVVSAAAAATVGFRGLAGELGLVLPTDRFGEDFHPSLKYIDHIFGVNYDHLLSSMLVIGGGGVGAILSSFLLC